MSRKNAKAANRAAAEPVRYYRPVNARLVLLAAMLFPGVGQALNNSMKRGFMMVCSMLLLGMATWHLTHPDISLVGRLAGGIFIYAVSIMDAYRWARYREEYFRQHPQPLETA